MSGGKKNFKRKKTNTKTVYSYSEVKRAIRDAADETTKEVMLLCLCAARDTYDLDGDSLVEFMQNMQRYIRYEKDGDVKLKDASRSIKERTGIDLTLSRWKK